MLDRMIIRNWEFDMNRMHIMGILNVTPDSFSDGGSYIDCQRAVERALIMEEEGAEIIDIGGESTRPGFEPVGSEEEIQRVLPVIEGIRKHSDIPISIDTTKYQVAETCIDAGADIINDISFLRDSHFIDLLKAKQVVYILTHNEQYAENISKQDYLQCFHKAIERKLNELAAVSRDKLILDPGIGFGKTTTQNLWLIEDIAVLKQYEAGVLMAASNKTVIGNTLQLPVNERLEGTLAITAYSLMKGTGFVRVHDVKANKRLIDMLEMIIER